ncbi:hypothetical protein J1N35_028831 [Gossypium stocksii]|uniref:DUF8040 domain-containing protein n=1 Tax=Gossypium stocksii TaxID=47602 RepID=A0A9D3UYN6_9ROSI|nr:hypothetical protein J1N35_028831 [Gossypium stocksii]
MLQTLGGLKSSRNILVDKQVAMFLHIISHHLKNRVIKHHFNSSRETVSRSFHNVLNVVIRLQDVLFKKAKTIIANSLNPSWKWFKEGSVADEQVLRDAISRRHALKVPQELEEGLPSNLIDNNEPNIVKIHPSDAWVAWRMKLANQMFNEWQASRN